MSPKTQLKEDSLKRSHKKQGKGKSTKVRDLRSDRRRGVDVALGKTLTSEEEKVLRMRFGLSGDTRTQAGPREEGNDLTDRRINLIEQGVLERTGLGRPHR